jgi:ferritin-like metal-binding protein YciE
MHQPQTISLGGLANMATQQENLLDWLRDAHAMEQQAEKMLKAQSERLEHYPQLKARIDFHIRRRWVSKS